MSSHREAPEISKDPVADNTDVYAFVSPDRPSTVTLIANFIPLQNPMGGPNFFEFGDDVLYEIHISNRGDAKPDVTYQFRFTTKVRNPNTFLYNTGPIANIGDTTFNRPQTYSVTRVTRGGGSQGPRRAGWRSRRSTSVSGAPRTTSTSRLRRRTRCPVAGSSSPASARTASSSTSGRSSTSAHFARSRTCTSSRCRPWPGSTACRVSTCTPSRSRSPRPTWPRDGKNPTDVMDAGSVIGVYASASRQKTTVLDAKTGKPSGHGPWQQVSRLGNPLFNEVIVPMASKDRWNALDPWADSAFAKYVSKPELAGLLPVLYPGVFPNLKAYTKPRADLLAILLTGIPAGVVPGFQNFTGTTQADLLRLNLAVPPSGNPNPLGLVAGDAAGFPNGRRRLRRRRHGGAACGRRADHPAGRPELHAGRRDVRDQGRDLATPTPRTSTTSRTSGHRRAGSRPSPAFRRPEPPGRRRTGPVRRRPSPVSRSDHDP